MAVFIIYKILAVTDSAVNLITSRGKFFEEKLAGASISIMRTKGAGWVTL